MYPRCARAGARGWEKRPAISHILYSHHSLLWRCCRCAARREMARPRRRRAICMLTKCECTFPVYVLRVAPPRVARGPRGFSGVLTGCIVCALWREWFVLVIFICATCEHERPSRRRGGLGTQGRAPGEGVKFTGRAHKSSFGNFAHSLRANASTAAKRAHRAALLVRLSRLGSGLSHRGAAQQLRWSLASPPRLAGLAHSDSPQWCSRSWCLAPACRESAAS